MAQNPLNFTPILYDYFKRYGLRPNPILNDLHAYMQLHPQAQMQSALEVAYFLSFMVHLRRPSEILEIGTFAGYSALSMALVPNFQGHITTCDNDPKITKIAQDFWHQANVSSKITLMLDDALNTLALLEDKNYLCDMVFIDADKYLYDQYYEYSLRLINPQGLIIIDNVFGSGLIAEHTFSDPEPSKKEKRHNNILKNLHRFNEKIQSDSRINSYMLPISDGLMLIEKL